MALWPPGLSVAPACLGGPQPPHRPSQVPALPAPALAQRQRLSASVFPLLCGSRRVALTLTSSDRRPPQAGQSAAPSDKTENKISCENNIRDKAAHNSHPPTTNAEAPAPATRTTTVSTSSRPWTQLSSAARPPTGGRARNARRKPERGSTSFHTGCCPVFLNPRQIKQHFMIYFLSCKIIICLACQTAGRECRRNTLHIFLGLYHLPGKEASLAPLPQS